MPNRDRQAEYRRWRKRIESDPIELTAYKKRCADKAKKRYRENPEHLKEIARRSRKKVDDIVYAVKDQPCADCRRSFPTCAMQFDHVKGVKVANIAELRTRGSVKEVLDEMAKCDVVCANCHAIRTCIRDKRPKARQCVHES